MKSLRRGLADATVADVVTLLSMVLGEAVEEGLIGSNPCRKLRLGSGRRPERLTARSWQVVGIAERGSPTDRVLIISAAYTGMRWGELAGLRWRNVDLARAIVTIDPDNGALHEVGGRLMLGPPKTPASVRSIHLPLFLVDELTAHRATQHGEHVFTGTDGGLLRRSNFRDRVWVPATAGKEQRGWAPILPGLRFHDLRHTHKTWLIEDGVPEVLQHDRLGHRLPGVRGVYSHVTQVMIDAMLVGLQRRWDATSVELTCGRAQDRSSQIPPTDAERPVGDDHRRAV